VKPPNQMDSRNRDAKEVLADLWDGSKPCRLTIAGSNRLDASATAGAPEQGRRSSPGRVRARRIVTGCCPPGEKAARIVAKS